MPRASATVSVRQHRFEKFTVDFSTWVIFFGPEVPAPA